MGEGLFKTMLCIPKLVYCEWVWFCVDKEESLLSTSEGKYVPILVSTTTIDAGVLQFISEL